MAFGTKDGQRRFGSAFRAKRYDEFHKDEKSVDTPEHEAKESPEFEAGEQEGAKEGKEPMEHEAPHEVVAQHGPAHSVSIHHDYENKKHKVVSHHKDGHMHESDHATAAEAHDHGKQLMQADEQDRLGDQAEAAQEDMGGDQLV